MRGRTRGSSKLDTIPVRATCHLEAVSSNDDFLASVPDRKAPPPPPKRRQALQAAPGTSVTQKGAYAPWMLNVVCDNLREGATLKTCAARIRVNPRTLTTWLTAGRKEGATAELEELALAVEEARADYVSGLVEVVKVHAFKDWRAAEMLLRAADPETYSPQHRSKVDITVTRDDEEDLSGLSDEQLAARAEQDEIIKTTKALKRALPA